jgi:hypothetical protein
MIIDFEIFSTSLQSRYSPISRLHPSSHLDFSPAVLNISWDTVDKIVLKCLGKENMDRWWHGIEGSNN